MRVLITGASGCLAPFVFGALSSDCDVTLTSRTPPGAWAGNAVFVKADLTDFAEATASVRAQDAVIHLASVVTGRIGLPPSAFADGIVKATWNLAEAAVRAGVRRIVNVSSILAGGRPRSADRPYRVGDPALFPPEDLGYPLAKALAEQILDAYAQSHGVSVIHLRPGVVSGDPRNAEPSPLAPAGFHFRHVDPRDVAEAVRASLVSDLHSGCFHVVAARPDAMFDMEETEAGLGFVPRHNWPEIQPGGFT